MPKAIKVSRSRRERERYVQDWMDEYDLTKGQVQMQAHIDGMGVLELDDYYKMARGHRRENGSP